MDPKKTRPKKKSREMELIGLGEILELECPPVRPIDTTNPYPPVDGGAPTTPVDGGPPKFMWVWSIIIDGAIGLEPEAIKRIKQESRKAIHRELAEVAGGEIYVQATDRGLRVVRRL
jgi:hypothetical protein